MAVVTMPDPAFKVPVLERRIAANGSAYHERGTGEPLVLIHGVGMRLEAWEPQIDVLSETHRVIAVDMPGHGESAPLAVGSDIVAFVGWFRTFLDALSLDRVNVAGHSMGALIAGGAAAVYPERIRRVALLNGVFCRDRSAKKAVLERAKSIAEDGIDVDGPVQRWFDDTQASRVPRALTRAWLSGMNRENYATAYSAFAGGDAVYAYEWPKVKCPALFLTGSGDPNSTPDMSRQMAALAPRGVARIIQGHRHMVNLTAPEAINALMRDWLLIPECAA